MMIICKDDVVKFVFPANVDISKAPGAEGYLKIKSTNPKNPDLIVHDILYSEAQIYQDVVVALPEGFGLNQFKFVNGNFVRI